MEWFDSWALPLTVFVPLVGALFILLIPKDREDAIKGVGLLTAAWPSCSAGRGRRVRLLAVAQHLSFRSTFLPWRHQLQLHLGVDGISCLSWSCPRSWCCSSSTQNHGRARTEAFLILMLILATGMNGTSWPSDRCSSSSSSSGPPADVLHDRRLGDRR